MFSDCSGSTFALFSIKNSNSNPIIFIFFFLLFCWTIVSFLRRAWVLGSKDTKWNLRGPPRPIPKHTNMQKKKEHQMVFWFFGTFNFYFSTNFVEQFQQRFKESRFNTFLLVRSHVFTIKGDFWWIKVWEYGQSDRTPFIIFFPSLVH